MLSISLSFVDVEVTTLGQIELQCTLFDVTWQQASKHINKLINGATVSMYRPKCVVVSGEKEAKG
jgi:acetolactate synthase small subunit